MEFRIKAEDFLAVFFWGAEKLFIPSFNNLNKSYETWEFERGLHHQFRLLERRQLLKRRLHDRGTGFQLTSEGVLAALGGCNPRERWEKPWDRRWRMILFDIPVDRQVTRVRLWRWLRRKRFGFLQQSVWISPHPVENVLQEIKNTHDVQTFLVMEGHCSDGYSEQEAVQSSWDFTAINLRYSEYLAVAREEVEPGSKAFLIWLQRERVAWASAIRIDPLLPLALHPPGYLGPEAWQARENALRSASACLT